MFNLENRLEAGDNAKVGDVMDSYLIKSVEQCKSSSGFNFNKGIVFEKGTGENKRKIFSQRRMNGNYFKRYDSDIYTFDYTFNSAGKNLSLIQRIHLNKFRFALQTSIPVEVFEESPLVLIASPDFGITDNENLRNFNLFAIAKFGNSYFTKKISLEDSLENIEKAVKAENIKTVKPESDYLRLNISTSVPASEVNTIIKNYSSLKGHEFIHIFSDTKTEESNRPRGKLIRIFNFEKGLSR